MKVYYVEAFSGEQYTDYTWVHSIYSTKEKAEAFIKGMGPGVHDENLADYEYGYYIRQDCVEMEVQ